jgi:hypothetical protein
MKSSMNNKENFKEKNINESIISSWYFSGKSYVFNQSIRLELCTVTGRMTTNKNLTCVAAEPKFIVILWELNKPATAWG